jgi:ubiquinone/menaquinone biosynthesis C-methylase UbiE
MERSLRRDAALRAPPRAPAHGDVIEIGFGAGLNLPHYPAAVRSLVAVDPMRALPRRAAERIDAASFPVERVHVPADAGLPFPDHRFDCAVTTWTLCSIDDPAAALAELRRVLRGDGLYLFLEHGLSDHPRWAAWQRGIAPVRRWFGGCRIDLPVDGLVAAAGFVIVDLARFQRRGRRGLTAQAYRGVARPAKEMP